LETVERLDLRFLVDTKHTSAFGRIEVETDDVSDLLHEVWVGGELEALGPVGLETKGLPDAGDRGLAQTHRFGHRTCRPVGGIGGLFLQGLDDHLFDLVVGDGAGGARPRVIGQPIEAVFNEALPPLADHGIAHPQMTGDLLVGVSFGTAHHDARPQGHGLRALSSVGQPLERQSLFGGEHQLGLGASSWCHRCLPLSVMTRENAPTRKKFPDLRYFPRTTGSGH